MAWFWFWVITDLSILALDAAWWIVAVRLTKSRLLRIVVSLFMAGQILAFVSAICGVAWWFYMPKSVLIAVLVWHQFVLPLSVVLLASLAIGIWLRRRLRRPPSAPTAQSALTRRQFIGACAALAPPLFTLGPSAVALAQLNHFRVRRFTLAIPALPRALDGMTIAHISDMHVGKLTSSRMLRQMVNTTNAFRADLVVMTGDLIHYELEALSEAITLVKAMQARAGLWMVEGNHDLFDNADEFERRVKAAGLPLLLDDSAVTNVRGHPVQLFGLRWLDHDERQKVTSLQVRNVMTHRQPDAFPILLAHHPHAFDAAAAANLPLTLAGHTHGGQWMLNRRFGVGPILFRYWSGLYTLGRSQMIVSNGIGNIFPIRINAPAEIAHIILRCA